MPRRILPPLRLVRRLVRPLLLLALAGCASIPFLGGARTRWWGFVAPWDPLSGRSAAAHGAALDAAVTGWIGLDSITGQPRALYADTLGLPAGPRRFALVTTYAGDRFHPEVVRALAGDAPALAAAAAAVARLSSGTGTRGYDGLVLDLEGLGPADVPALVRVTDALTRAAHAAGVGTVAIAIPAPDTAGYPARPLAEVTDLLMVMLYDEHWLGSLPGPVASPAWARTTLARRIGEVGASRLVAAFPLYGYQWYADKRPTAVVSYATADSLAAGAGTRLEREPATWTLRARTPAERGTPWELWVSDAGLLDTLVHDAREAGVHTIALWRLGLEDPAVWTRTVGR